MKLAIVGTGYVGLVSGVCLAAKGHRVTCVDIDPAIVARLEAGEPTIHERGLPDLLATVRSCGRFRATTSLAEALTDAEIVILAVGTPSVDGRIDLTYVREAARQIGLILRDREEFLSVVVKSTVLPGTTDTVVREEIERASGKLLGQFGLGMNPEFLREGEAIADFADPDRIVLGHEDARTLALLEELYAPWPVDKLRVNTRTAELIKYANNFLLATQISAVNELANLSAAIGGVDVLDVVKGVHLDRRWNPVVHERRVAPEILTYLVPGCGFGGSCFPKDVQALRSQGLQHGMPMRMANAVLDINDQQPGQVATMLARACGDLSGKRVLLLGLAFKPGTDDVRESASLKIAATLLAAGAVIRAHDPIAGAHFRKAMGGDVEGLSYLDDWRGAVADSDIVVLATKWPEYEDLCTIDLAGKVVFDARRMFASPLSGARYLTIGRRIEAA